MTAGAAAPAPQPNRVLAFLARFEDAAIIRAAFYGLLAGTAGVLTIDYLELRAIGDQLAPPASILPSALPAAPGFEPDRRVTTDRAVLESPLSIALVSGGVLALIGTVDTGSAERFRAEVEARGEYVGTVRLDSPGGSVRDALAIGALIREHGLSTSVDAGSLCASSCPLMLAGGVERVVSPQAVIGVHQVYPAAIVGDIASLEGVRAVGSAMADAQTVTAAIARHFETMGIGSGAWLHAIETPPNQLYYFTEAELLDLRLATVIKR